MELEEASAELRSLLDRVVRENPAPGVLVSGGIDTSIIAFLAKKYVPQLKAFTVTLKGYDRDLKYARKLARFLDLDHRVHFFTRKELTEAILEAADILDSSQEDPPLPSFIVENQIEGDAEPVSLTALGPTYLAMKFAKGYVDGLLCGDGADELFLGYSSITEFIDFVTDNLDGDLFPSFGQGFDKELQGTIFRGCDLRYPYLLGKALDLKVRFPYLTPEVYGYARQLPLELKVRAEGGKVWGKWILRKAFEKDLPPELIWREKTTIDSGTGSIEFYSAK